MPRLRPMVILFLQRKSVEVPVCRWVAWGGDGEIIAIADFHLAEILPTAGCHRIGTLELVCPPCH